MKSSGNYGEKFYYKLPHAVTNSLANKDKDAPPAIEKDVYVKQEQQFEQV